MLQVQWQMARIDAEWEKSNMFRPMNIIFAANRQSVQLQNIFYREKKCILSLSIHIGEQLIAS